MTDRKLVLLILFIVALGLNALRVPTPASIHQENSETISQEQSRIGYPSTLSQRKHAHVKADISDMLLVSDIPQLTLLSPVPSLLFSLVSQHLRNELHPITSQGPPAV